MSESKDTPEVKKTRKRNGDGYTYPFRQGFRTVIENGGRSFTATGKTATESARNAKAKLREARPLNVGRNTDGGRMKISEYMPKWLEQTHKRVLADTTYKRYQGLANNHIIPLLGNKELRSVTKNDVNELVRLMDLAGQSARSQHQARAVLSAMFVDAINNDAVLHNPVTNSSKVKIQQHEAEPLSLDEAKRVVANAQSTALKLRWRIALFYGLRQGEVLGLRWKDINLTAKTLAVRVQMQKVDKLAQFVPLKSRSSRRILPLDSETVMLFRTHKAEQAAQRLAAGTKWVDNDLVFPNAEGKFMQSSWDSKLWHRALAASEVTDRRLHDARHTCATILHANGHDVEAIRRFLGHSSIQMTSSTYIHGDPKPLMGIAGTLEEIASEDPLAS